ncbi:HAMP domain-containing sensor histidine kinase [Nodosilinea sp. LEGE 06152]|uniref:sensor histidine kinase n=1 Tax=Nodosilinea sp. LEGE 06152 TaxID=2777966 RepID=UPI001D15CA10|nr:HAMP domain-containing sensor histidine kinase [Nodosilinea sp. LEGE 06152]
MARLAQSKFTLSLLPLSGWRQILGEARSRILIWYLLLMSLSSVASVLTVRQLLFVRLDERVEQSLYQEVEEFRQLRNGRNPETGQPFDQDIKAIFDVFLSRNIPEDNEYLLAIVDGEFYKASSLALPMALRPDSVLMQEWAALTQPRQDGEATLSGTVLYLAEPITAAGQVRGVFVVAHMVSRDRAEVTESVLIIAQVSLVVLAIASALAWFAAGRVLAPLRLLSQTARLITESNLTERIPLERATGDIAELTRTFNDMLDRIEATFNSQRQLLNDVGHELRTPITIIRGHLELMGTTPQEQQETLDIVIDELDRMSRFIDELMLLAKAERPDFLFPEPIDLTAFTEELYAKITALGDRRWQLEAIAAGQLVGDRQRLTEAIVNLAQNATQHTRSGDTIALGSSCHNDQIHLWVRDTGEGIDPADQTRIFQRFVRGKSRYGRSDGSGLGLAIVQAIVQAHGGSIQLASQPDQGATFTLVLPLKPL